MTRTNTAMEHAMATLNFHLKRCKACDDGVEMIDSRGGVLIAFCPEGERLSAIADQAAEALNREEAP